jgi:hypothetical protein
MLASVLKQRVRAFLPKRSKPFMHRLEIVCKPPFRDLCDEAFELLEEFKVQCKKMQVVHDIKQIYKSVRDADPGPRPNSACSLIVSYWTEQHGFSHVRVPVSWAKGGS